MARIRMRISWGSGGREERRKDGSERNEEARLKQATDSLKVEDSIDSSAGALVQLHRRRGRRSEG